MAFIDLGATNLKLIPEVDPFSRKAKLKPKEIHECIIKASFIMFPRNGYRVESTSLGKLTSTPLPNITTNITAAALSLLAAACQITQDLSGNCQGDEIYLKKLKLKCQRSWERRL